MDRGNGWNFKIRQPIENPLPALNESAHFAGSRCLEESLQIRARDKDGFFCGRDDQAPNRRVFFNGIKVLIQFIESCRVKNVRARVGTIKREHANVIVTSLAANYWSCDNCRHPFILERFRQLPSVEDQSSLKAVAFVTF